MLYNKVWDSGYDELITYYPLFYRNVKEMDAILRAHGELSDNLEDSIEQVFANNFVDTMDETAIARLEKFLDIPANSSRTLDERRRLIKSFFAGAGKVSASMLAGMIQSYTNAPVEVTFEPFDEEGNNRLMLKLDRGTSKTIYMSDINLLLSKKVPAHIFWQAGIVYPFPIGIGIKRKHYVFNYDLTGTKPDIASIGLAVAIASVIQSKRKHATMTYETIGEDKETGLKPDIAMIASYLSSESAIGAKAEIVLSEYKQTQNEDLKAGTWPSAAALGEYQKIASAIGVDVETLVAAYSMTGTAPETSTLADTKEIATTIAAEVENIVASYEASGTSPDASLVADTNGVNAAAGAKVSDYSVTYTYCGTGYAQS